MLDPIDNVTDSIRDARMVIVIGGTDTGKSTIIKHLAARMDAAVVDGDIGQSDIGPPTVVSLGEKVHGQYRMVDGYFCGSASPSGHLLQLLAGMARMARAAKKQPILVNTTGLATGNIGRSLNTEMIHALDPDVIIGIGNGDELRYLDAFSQEGARIIHLPISPLVKEKTKSEREQNRQWALKEHFEGASSRVISTVGISIERSLLFNGTEREIKNMPGIIHAETSGNEAVVVCEDSFMDASIIKERLKAHTLELYTIDDMAGTLVGLVGSNGKFLGLGIIEHIDFIDSKIRLFTPVSNFQVLQFGSIKLRIGDFKYMGPFKPKVHRA